MGYSSVKIVIPVIPFLCPLICIQMSVLMGMIANTSVIISYDQKSSVFIHFSIFIEAVILSVILYYVIQDGLSIDQIIRITVVRIDPAFCCVERSCNTFIGSQITGVIFFVIHYSDRTQRSIRRVIIPAIVVRIILVPTTGITYVEIIRRSVNLREPASRLSILSKVIPVSIF